MSEENKSADDKYIDEQWERLAQELEAEDSSLFNNKKSAEVADADVVADKKADSVPLSSQSADEAVKPAAPKPQQEKQTTVQQPHAQSTPVARSLFDPVDKGATHPRSDIYKRQSVEIPATPPTYRVPGPFDGSGGRDFAVGPVHHPWATDKYGGLKRFILFVWTVVLAISGFTMAGMTAMPFFTPTGYLGAVLMVGAFVIPLIYLHIMRYKDKKRYWAKVKHEGHQIYMGDDMLIHSSLDPAAVKANRQWFIVGLAVVVVFLIGCLLFSVDVGNHTGEIEQYLNQQPHSDGTYV